MPSAQRHPSDPDLVKHLGARTQVVRFGVDSGGVPTIDDPPRRHQS